VRNALRRVAGLGLCALAVLLIVALGWVDGRSRAATVTVDRVAAGQALYLESCSSCHGDNLQGVSGRGPTLKGGGELAADFYLSTGRMPLKAPGLEPVRSDPAFSSSQIADLVAYIGSFGGPGIPHVDTASASLTEGLRLYADRCAGCHQITGTGGVVPGAVAPPLTDATATQIAEAIRIGPYVMPKWSESQLTNAEVASIARYAESAAKSPQDPGGWAIGHLGPIPEGMVAWFIGLGALLVVARLLGERSE
jgi:ubiquinol-cytochrome c reductase cytochrome c subunit